MTQGRRELARCKVNLTLHVTGRRGDGYHLLDSLVVFPEIGDVLEVSDAAGLTLEISGPFAAALAGADNLVLRAARLLRAQERGAALHLIKNLPVASGIGGGSSDAAAALRLLCRHWDLDAPSLDALLALGADVPVCMDARPARMRGIGDRLEPVAGLPQFWLVLANHGAQVSTSAVFRELRGQFGPSMPAAVPHPAGFDDFVGFLAQQRNDLEFPAGRLCAGIGEALDLLRRLDGCRLARMSGSGGTCFGLFETETRALGARDSLRAARPAWWVEAGAVLPG